MEEGEVVFDNQNTPGRPSREPLRRYNDPPPRANDRHTGGGPWRAGPHPVDPHYPYANRPRYVGDRRGSPPGPPRGSYRDPPRGPPPAYFGGYRDGGYLPERGVHPPLRPPPEGYERVGHERRHPGRGGPGWNEPRCLPPARPEMAAAFAPRGHRSRSPRRERSRGRVSRSRSNSPGRDRSPGQGNPQNRGGRRRWDRGSASRASDPRMPESPLYKDRPVRRSPHRSPPRFLTERRSRERGPAKPSPLRSRSPPRTRSPMHRSRSPRRGGSIPRGRSPPSRGRSPPSRGRSPPRRGRSPPSRRHSPELRPFPESLRAPAATETPGKQPPLPPAAAQPSTATRLAAVGRGASPGQPRMPRTTLQSEKAAAMDAWRKSVQSRSGANTGSTAPPSVSAATSAPAPATAHTSTPPSSHSVATNNRALNRSTAPARTTQPPATGPTASSGNGVQQTPSTSPQGNKPKVSRWGKPMGTSERRSSHNPPAASALPEPAKAFKPLQPHQQTHVDIIIAVREAEAASETAGRVADAAKAAAANARQRLAECITGLL